MSAQGPRCWSPSHNCTGRSKWMGTDIKFSDAILKSPTQSGHGSWPPPPPPLEQWQRRSRRSFYFYFLSDKDLQNLLFTGSKLSICLHIFLFLSQLYLRAFAYMGWHGTIFVSFSKSPPHYKLFTSPLLHAVNLVQSLCSNPEIFWNSFSTSEKD